MNPTTYTTLITAEQLMALRQNGSNLMLFDCSFDLMKPEAGEQQYEQSHLPGAVYMHLDRDLSDKSGAADAASGGRHPLPSRETFAARLRELGFSQGMQAVVYDRQGSSFCGRLWWMLKWCGHEAVAVLDGGHGAWLAAGGATESGACPPPAAQGDFQARPALASTVSASEICRHLGDGTHTLVDARAAARFRGEMEPLDPVAGHIPGALNRPFGSNVEADGRFKRPEVLRAEFEALLAGRNPSTVVHQCGSGVSAIPNLLAMEIAGLGRAALFPGSWSEWCNTPGMPCARG